MRINFKKRLYQRIEELIPLAVSATEGCEHRPKVSNAEYYAAGKLNGMVETLQSILQFYEFCERQNDSKLVRTVDNLIDTSGIFHARQFLKKGDLNGPK